MNKDIYNNLYSCLEKLYYKYNDSNYKKVVIIDELDAYIYKNECDDIVYEDDDYEICLKKEGKSYIKINNDIVYINNIDNYYYEREIIVKLMERINEILDNNMVIH